MDSDKPSFTPAEIEQLKAGLKRNYKERFEMATRLYKIQMTMQKATITHQPFIKSHKLTTYKFSDIPLSYMSFRP